MQRQSHLPDHEQGYVLINVIWLLLLAASIIALIVQSGQRLDKTVRSEYELVRQQMALESALQSAIMDIAISSAVGKTPKLPLVRTYTIGGLRTQVTIMNEAGKLDVNHAEPELIRRGLQGLGVPGYVASNLSVRLAEDRKAKKRIATLEHMDEAFAMAGLDFGRSQFCPRRYFTIFSQSSQPDIGAMRQDLLRALNIPVPTERPAPRVINAVAVKVRTIGGPSIFARVLAGKTGNQTPQLLHFNRAQECSI